ncbi:MAG: amidohydrolase [Eubacterium sp.]|jgi:5-methylthioadenosine/S-adenosylhomocysteine deaminase|nr:amidohydrolase [Eubacterium sp.]
MKTRFFNAKILCLDKNFEIIEGELHTNKDKISYIGPGSDDPNSKFDEQIDTKGNLLMPGLKNAHTHSAMTFLRSYADDLPLKEWLFEKIFPMEHKIENDPEYVYQFTKLALLEYISSGTTSVFDMYYHPFASARAAKEYGFRYVFCGAVAGDDVSKLSDLYDSLNSFDPLVSFLLGFHAEYTTPKKSLKEISELANSKRLPVYTHNSETKNEVAGCIERYGKTPTALFEEIGLYNYGGGGFHSVHLTDEDIKIFKSRGVYAIVNPCSNLKLASGICPAKKLYQNGVNLAVGTDGASSNNALSLWREIYLLSTLQKYLFEDAAAMPAPTALQIAVRGSANAMLLSNCDCLAPGKQADLIMIDLNKPNMQPVNNTINNLVYSGTDSNVMLTMIAGKKLYHNGEFFVGEDPEKLYEKVNSLIKNLK